MLASSVLILVSGFLASRPRDATHRMSATELVCAAPLQQRLRHSSDSVAAPSQQHYNLALDWSSHRRVPSRGAACITSRRDAAAPRRGTRAVRSTSYVAKASAPSQQQKQTTAVSRDHKRSTGLQASLWKWRNAKCIIGQPLELFATGRHRTKKLSWFRINLPKELGHSPDKEGLIFF